MNRPLITIENLQVNIGELSLLKKINLTVQPGEIVALIGESGSGKSLTAKVIMGLLPQQMNSDGRIIYKNRDVLKSNKKERRRLLGKELALIFQDYRGSFTPFIKIGKQMVETVRTHQDNSKKEAQMTVIRVLDEMGLDSKRVYNSYSFQLSGGQVQRASIAMALALNPSLLICDEMTTALDVMSGEKVLNYIDHVRRITGCAVLMITHDLAQAYKRADRIYVMHQGEVVEEGLPEQIRCNHKHPYTKKLCSCLLALPEESKLLDERMYSI